jgi:hypothetical protein
MKTPAFLTAAIYLSTIAITILCLNSEIYACIGPPISLNRQRDAWAKNALVTVNIDTQFKDD